MEMVYDHTMLFDCIHVRNVSQHHKDFCYICTVGELHVRINAFVPLSLRASVVICSISKTIVILNPSRCLSLYRSLHLSAVPRVVFAMSYDGVIRRGRNSLKRVLDGALKG